MEYKDLKLGDEVRLVLVNPLTNYYRMIVSAVGNDEALDLGPSPQDKEIGFPYRNVFPEAKAKSLGYNYWYELMPAESLEESDNKDSYTPQVGDIILYHLFSNNVQTTRPAIVLEILTEGILVDVIGGIESKGTGRIRTISLKEGEMSGGYWWTRKPVEKKEEIIVQMKLDGRSITTQEEWDAAQIEYEESQTNREVDGMDFPNEKPGMADQFKADCELRSNPFVKNIDPLLDKSKLKEVTGELKSYQEHLHEGFEHGIIPCPPSKGGPELSFAEADSIRKQLAEEINNLHDRAKSKFERVRQISITINEYQEAFTKETKHYEDLNALLRYKQKELLRIEGMYGTEDSDSTNDPETLK